MSKTSAIAELVIAGILTGYTALAAKDVADGKTPREFSRDSFLEAAIQGGMGALYMDFILGTIQNPGASSVVANIAGPTASFADQVALIAAKAANGDDFAFRLAKLARTNTPFMNMFYAKGLLDYMITRNLNERFNPGWKTRETSRLHEKGQERLAGPFGIPLRGFEDDGAI